MVRVTHRKVSGKSQGSDPTRVYGNHWDEDHVVEGLDVGTDVQAHDATLDQLSGKSLSGEGAIALRDGATLNAPQINSPTGITRSDVGLGYVDNTSDADKPISDATQTALDALESATQAALDGKQPLDADLTAIAVLSGTGIARRTGVNAWSAGTAVANSELAMMAANTFKGNVSGSTAAPSDLTATEVTSALNVVTASAKGLAPQLPNDATKFLDGTGNYSAPTATGINFIQDGIGAVTRTIQDKAREWVSILDFGAVGDGDIANAATNSTALRNALAVGKSVRIPWTAHGYHFGANQIEISDGQGVVGENNVLLKSTSANSLFLMSGGGGTAPIGNSCVMDLSIDMTGAGSSSAAFLMNTNPGGVPTNVSHIRISNIKCSNCHAFYLEPPNGGYVYNIEVSNIETILSLGTQIWSRRSQGFAHFKNINIDGTIPGQSPITWTSMVFENFAGIRLTEIDVTGEAATVGSWQLGAIGIRISGVGTNVGKTFVWLDRVRAESTQGSGILVTNVNFVYSNFVETFGCIGNGIVFTACGFLQLSNIYARGFKGETGAIANSHGVVFDSCGQISGSTSGTGSGVIANLASESNTGNGLLVKDTMGLRISNLRLQDNVGWGIQETESIQGYTNNNVYIGRNSFNNTAGEISLVGSVSSTPLDGAWQTYTPTLVFAGGGAATYTSSGRYKRIGNTVMVQMKVAISALGTGVGFTRVTLPPGMNAASESTLNGKEIGLTSKSLTGFVGATGTNATVAYYDSANPAATGAIYSLSGVVEVM